MLDPTIEDTAADPACGSGNFLSQVISRFCVPGSPHYIQDVQARENYVRTKVFGRDIEQALVDIAQEYLRIVAGGIQPNIVAGDSLDLAAQHYRSLPFGRLTRVFTNPPFGTNIEVTNPAILEQFDLGHQLQDGLPSKQLLKGQHPDRLFLELCVKLLAEGGQAAIVLPRQILSGEESNAVETRKWLWRHTAILAVVDLPPETFQPHTGTITSLLVFRKGIPAARPPVFFAVCEFVGHDRRGMPLYELDGDGVTLRDEKGLPRLRDDTPRIAESWREYATSGRLDHQGWHGFLVEAGIIENHPLRVINAWAYNPDANEAYRVIMNLTENDAIETIAPLREVCKEIFIPGRHKRKYIPASDISVPFLSTTQIFHIHDIDYKHQPMSFAASQGLLVEEGWLLVTRSGSTGRVRYANRELSNCAISDHCIRIVPDETRVDGGYLYAFLSSKIGQLLIDQGRYASVIETISHTRLGDIPIPLPKMARQKEIGEMVRRSEEARVEANLIRQKAIESVERSFS